MNLIKTITTTTIYGLCLSAFLSALSVCALCVCAFLECVLLVVKYKYGICYVLKYLLNVKSSFSERKTEKKPQTETNCKVTNLLLLRLLLYKQKLQTLFGQESFFSDKNFYLKILKINKIQMFTRVFMNL